MTTLAVVSPDAEIESADWTKQSWDLPPYKSPEFLARCPNLEAFRNLPVYQHAVDKGSRQDLLREIEATAAHPLAFMSRQRD